MGNLRKTFALLVILAMAASSLIAVQPASATTKPSAPQFTVQIVDRSYTAHVGPSSFFNLETGEFTRWPAHDEVVYNYTAEVTITNQQFTPSGDDSRLYYVVRAKLHSETWPNETETEWCLNSTYTDRVEQSASQSTVVTYVFGDEVSAEGGQIDLQVDAEIGNYYYGPSFMDQLYGINRPSEQVRYFEFVSDSGWSTQTVTLNARPATPTPESVTTSMSNDSGIFFQTPTDTPKAPSGSSGLANLDWQTIAIAVLAASVIALCVAVAVLWRKKTIPPPPVQNQ
jgi:hypothetical protein